MSYTNGIIKRMSGDLRRIAEVAGVEAAIKIGRAFRGTYLYIRGVDDFVRTVRDTEIREFHSAGTGVRRLSHRYRLTERQIRNILCSGKCENIPEEIRRMLLKAPDENGG